MEHIVGQTYEKLNEILKYNESKITLYLEIQIQHFVSLYNTQQTLIKNHIPGILDPYYGITAYKQVVLQSFFKNKDLILTSNNLILQGLHGAAKIIMRQIFEFLLIGKYCCLTKKEGFIDRWLEGKQVNINDEVVKRLIKPNKEEFTDFWVMICNFTHATTFSNQGGFGFESNKEEIAGTYYTY